MGFDILSWAEETLGWKAMPWQRFLIIHANELLPGPKPQLRFRVICFLCARQNGKSSCVTVMSLYWMTHGNPKVLYSSASLDTAKDQWEAATQYALDNPEVFGPVRERRMNGHWSTELPQFRATYQVISANRRGGRGKSAVNRALVDELREHTDFDAMAAVQSTMLTVEGAQLWLTSNAGDSRAVVLNHYRALGQSGEDPELGYFEWSAKDDAELDDPEARAQANPGLGYTISERALDALMTGPAAVVKTENLCIGVASLRECVDPGAWETCLDVGTMDAHRSRVAVALDVSMDGQHCTLVAATALSDGRVRVESVGAWTSTTSFLAELPELLTRVRPRKVGWFPSGPAAAIATDLKAIKNQVELTGAEVTTACQSLANLVQAGRIAHSGDELLTDQLLGASKLASGDGWKFQRRGGGHVDAAFATAGAVHLARQIPPPSRLKVITAVKRADMEGGGPHGQDFR